MSVKVMGHIWELKMESPTLKFVLLAYGDHAHHDGSGIYPATETVASKTGYSTRTIRRSINKLVNMGLLIPDGIHAGYQTNRWKYNWKWATDSVSGVTESPEGGDRESGGGDRESGGGDRESAKVDRESPKPSLTIIKPSIKPEEEDTASPAAAAGLFEYYENNIGPLTQAIAERLKGALEEYPESWILDAMGIAVDMNKRSWRYAEVILERWMSEGKDDGRGKKKEISSFKAWDDESEEELQKRRAIAATMVGVRHE